MERSEPRCARGTSGVGQRQERRRGGSHQRRESPYDRFVRAEVSSVRTGSGAGRVATTPARADGYPVQYWCSRVFSYMGKADTHEHANVPAAVVSGGINYANSSASLHIRHLRQLGEAFVGFQSVQNRPQRQRQTLLVVTDGSLIQSSAPRRRSLQAKRVLLLPGIAPA